MGCYSRKDPHSPTEEISTGAREDECVSDNSKCIRTSEGGSGVNVQFPLWGGMDVFWNDPMKNWQSYDLWAHFSSFFAFVLL
jgi:hypothetical protein